MPMDKPESDIEFLDNLELWVIGSLVFKRDHRERLFALARRGAEMQSSDDDKRSAIRDLEKQGWKLPLPAGETE